MPRHLRILHRREKPRPDCRTSGRSSMIVPLSLGFSSQFNSLRTLIFEVSDSHVVAHRSGVSRPPCSVSIPEYATRSISPASHLVALSAVTPRGFTGGSTPSVRHCSRACRTHLFSPAAFDGLVPKIGSARLIHELESLLENKNYRHLRDELACERPRTLTSLQANRLQLVDFLHQATPSLWASERSN